MEYFVELLVNGALTGLMYSLVALGIVLIYKSAGVPNLAQGAIVMTAAYAVWLLAGAGLPLSAAIVLAAILMFALGLAVERLLLRRMVGQPIIMVVMLTLGLEIFLRGFGPGLLGAGPKSLDIGIGLAPVIIGDVFINRAYLIGGVVALVMVAASLLFFRTRLGTKLRAVSDDHVSSWAVGISVEKAIGISWGLPACRPSPPAYCGARSRASTGPFRHCCFRRSPLSSWAVWTPSGACSWAVSLSASSARSYRATSTAWSAAARAMSSPRSSSS